MTAIDSNKANRFCTVEFFGNRRKRHSVNLGIPIAAKRALAIPSGFTSDLVLDIVWIASKPIALAFIITTIDTPIQRNVFD